MSYSLVYCYCRWRHDSDGDDNLRGQVVRIIPRARSWESLHII